MAETEALRTAFSEVYTRFVVAELASHVAHKAKSPLAGMMLLASRMRKQLPEGSDALPGVAKLGEYINTLDATLTGLVEAVPCPSAKLRDIDANGPVELAASLVAERAEAQGVVVVSELAVGLPTVRADPDLLGCAISQLITNALDAMESGGTLSIGSRPAEAESEGPAPAARVEVTVVDTGPGVAGDAYEGLFEHFRTSRPGRMGMGLPVARRILELHSGELSLAPGSGGGTKALVTLPAAT